MIYLLRIIDKQYYYDDGYYTLLVYKKLKSIYVISLKCN